ncbi:MAG TPA: DUF3309 family protein [Pirellulales bacterium]|nr:DUF3309 family protein [Pirellulales bacterium]
MRLLLIVVLLLLVLGMLPVWPYAAAWNLGYFPSGIFGLVLLVVLVSALMGTGRRDPLV